MTQRYPKTLWDVFHGMFTTDEMNAVEEWGFNNPLVIDYELKTARHQAEISMGRASWFSEFRAAQQKVYFAVKLWYEENIRPKIEAEEMNIPWYMGGKSGMELKNKIDQLEKQEGKA